MHATPFDDFRWNRVVRSRQTGTAASAKRSPQDAKARQAMPPGGWHVGARPTSARGSRQNQGLPEPQARGEGMCRLARPLLLEI